MKLKRVMKQILCTVYLHFVESLRIYMFPVSHHQAVAMYTCDNWCVLYVLSTVGRPGVPADSRLRRATYINCCIYALLTRDDGLLASPKRVEV
jgi:hypothetical protein